jgi:diguanylate cyclase (GGDEF)-like protein
MPVLPATPETSGSTPIGSTLSGSTLIERAINRQGQDFPEAAALALLGGVGEVHAAPLSVKEIDTGIYRYVNAPMAALFGQDAGEVVGRTDAQLLSSFRAAALRAADHTAEAQHPQPFLTDHRFEWRGQRLHYEATRVVVPDPRQPQRRLVAALWTDRSQADEREHQLQALRAQLEADQRLIERLRREGSADSAAVSREQRVFDDQLRRELDLSARERREFTLVLIELDAAADLPEGVVAAELLAAARETLERLLMASVRAMDTTCRLSGDRFGVLLSGVGLATAHARAESLRRQCADYVLMVGGQPCGLRVSVGLASFPHSSRSKDDLVRSASLALLQAQERGGNQLKLAGMPFPRHGES